MAKPVEISTKDQSKARLRLWLHLLKSSKYVESQLRERLRLRFGTTLPRFDVMAMLQRSGTGLKMSQLSGELMVSNGNVTGIIDRLVAEGLVVRVSIKGDRRATLVRLTPKGETDFTTMARAHEGWVSELFSEVSTQDNDHMIQILAHIREPKS